MEEKNKKVLNIFKWILILFVILVISWFSITVYEFYRVKSDKKPLICLNEKRDIESNDEYSITCYGILYKYREYYLKDDDSMTAKEFSLFFKDFKREVAEYEFETK